MLRVAGIAAAALALLAPSTAGAVGFGSPTQYGNGVTTAQTEFATADFNRDGASDIAIAASAGTSVFLGNGTGGFGDPVNYASGPSGIATGDFNNDGKLDLASAEFTNGVKTWLGDGAGAFTPSTNPAVGTRDLSIASADFNGDRFADLAVGWCGMQCPGGTGNTGLAILLSDGSGGFAAPISLTLAATVVPYYLVLGEFNGDGKTDLAVTLRDGSSFSEVIYVGDGTGHFTPGTPQALASIPQAAAAGDFNSDGKLDLAVTNGSAVSVFLGDGAGGLGARNDLPVGTGEYGVAVADFDGDGKQDLAVAGFTASGNAVSVLLGNGGSGFVAPQAFATNAGSPTGVAAPDLNGDGQPDLVVTDNSGANSVTVLLNNAKAGASLSAGALDFGRVRIRESAGRTETVTNNGTGVLRVSAVRLGGPDAAEFAVANDGCSGRTLTVGATCQVGLTFNAAVHAQRNATLSLDDNAPGSPHTVSLTGTALQPIPAISRFRMTRRKFAVSPRRPRGTVFLLTVDERCSARIRIQRRVRRGRHIRYRTVGSILRNVNPGPSRIKSSGRINRRELARGRYRAVLVCSTDGGVSAPRRVSFRVVRGRR